MIRSNLIRLTSCLLRLTVAVVAAQMLWMGSGLLARAFSWTEFTFTVEATSVEALKRGSYDFVFPTSSGKLRQMDCRPNSVETNVYRPTGQTEVACRFLVASPFSDSVDLTSEIAEAKAKIHEYARPKGAITSTMFEFRFKSREVIWCSGLGIGHLESVLLLLGALTLAWTIGFPNRFARVDWSPAVLGKAFALAFVPPLLMAVYLASRVSSPQHELVPDAAGGLLIVLAVRPLAEELFYRTWLIEWLSPALGRWGSVLAGATLFAFGHEPSEILNALALFSTGAFLGYLWLRFRSIVVCSACHSLVNAAITFLQ